MNEQIITPTYLLNSALCHYRTWTAYLYQSDVGQCEAASAFSTSKAYLSDVFQWYRRMAAKQ